MTQRRRLVSRELFFEGLGAMDSGANAPAGVERTAWDAVGGYDGVKAELGELARVCVNERRSASKCEGPRRSRGLLLVGPPGVGKSLLARAFAGACNAALVSENACQWLALFVDEAQEAVRRTFAAARDAAPSVLVLDDLEVLGEGSGNVSKVVEQLLVELDRQMDDDKVVFVVATTQRCDVRRALLAPGRLDTIIIVPMPSVADRTAILRSSLRDCAVGQGVDLCHIAACLEGFTGADLVAICHEAAKACVRDHLDAEANDQAPEFVGPIEKAHFERALAATRRSIPQSELTKFAEFESAVAAWPARDVELWGGVAPLPPLRVNDDDLYN